MVPPISTSGTPMKSRKIKGSRSDDTADLVSLTPLVHRSDSQSLHTVIASPQPQVGCAATPAGTIKASDTTTSIPSTPGNTLHIGHGKFLHMLWSRWQRRLPCLKKVQQSVLRIPPKYRYAFVFFWFCWKIALGLFMLIVFVRRRSAAKEPSSSMSSGLRNTIGAVDAGFGIPLTGEGTGPTRILYIVTTLSEFNTGKRNTVKGQDRLGEVLIPVLVDSIQSLVDPPFNYEVDVFLICAYKLLPEREQLIREALPYGVGLQVWDDAAPLGYEAKHSPDKVIDNTRALARQHRYVIKDKIPYYDMFVAFEDDMRITGHHVQHHWAISHELDLLRQKAPESLPDVPETLDDYQKTKFFGDMTKQQLARVIPGMIRVEVLLNETEYGAQTKVLPIERDFNFDLEGTGSEDHLNGVHVDPRICCHVNMTPNVGTPKTPKFSALVTWETNIKAFSLRQFPEGSSILNWAVLMMGPGKRQEASHKLGGYWSGRDGAFGKEPRPSGGAPALIAQQGGWMLTRDQISRMHDELCFQTFLPPFDRPDYSGDGQNSMNVEFWSGGYQIFTGVKGGCNMQRIISMHPDHFSKHLIYHVANNKQRQIDQERLVRADDLFGQLNTVRKMAQRVKQSSARSRRAKS